MDPTAKVAIADHVVFRRTNSALCMLFDRDKGVMYELNETASQFVSMLHEGPRTMGELTTTLASVYEAAEETIGADVGVLVDELGQAGLLLMVKA